MELPENLGFYAACGMAAYFGVWIYFTEIHSPRTDTIKRRPSMGLAALLVGAFIVSAAWTAGVVAQVAQGASAKVLESPFGVHKDATVLGALGAATMIVAICVHSTQTATVAMAAGLCWALWLAGVENNSCIFVGIVCLVSGFIPHRGMILELLGHAFSGMAAAGVVLGAHFWLLNAPSPLTMALLVPFGVVASSTEITSHPERNWATASMATLGSLVVALMGVWNGWTSESGSVQLAAAAALVLAWTGWRHFGRLPPVLGPFDPIEVRGATLMTASWFVSTSALASASPQALSAISWFSAGAVTALAFLAIVLLITDKWNPVTGGNYRWAMLDAVILVPLGAAGLWSLLSFSPFARDVLSRPWTMLSTNDIVLRAVGVYTNAFGAIRPEDSFETTAIGGGEAATFESWALSAVCMWLAFLWWRIASLRHPLLSSLFAEVVWQGGRSEKSLALTFNGINNDVGPALLDALKEADAHATFFVTASQARAYRELISRAVDEGHEIGVLGTLAGSLGPSEAHDEMARGRYFIGQAVDDPAVAENASDDEDDEAAHHAAADALASPGLRLAAETPVSRTHDAALLEDEDRARRLAARAAPSTVVWYRPHDGCRDARILREATALGMDVALWSALPWGPDDDDSPGCVAERMSREMEAKGAVVAINVAAPDHLCHVPGDHAPALAASAGGGTAMRAWRSADEVLAVVDEVLRQSQAALGVNVVPLSSLLDGKFLEV